MSRQETVAAQAPWERWEVISLIIYFDGRADRIGW